jgi:hypothetical protein
VVSPQEDVMARLHVSLAAALLLTALPAAAQETAPPQGEMVSIEVVGAKSNVVSLQTGGSWPLTIRLLANWPIGIGTVLTPDPYPERPQRGFIVFADPDDCFSFSLEQLQGSAVEPCPGGHDETYLEFTPDLNVVGLEKSGNYDDPTAPPPPPPAEPPVIGLNPLMLTLGDRLSVPSWDTSPPAGNNARAYPGPPTGDDVKDNYGFGASPAIPGLVILSDTGVGNVWMDDVVAGELKGITLVSPRTARNLAGFTNLVGLTLNDRKSPTQGRASVTAALHVGRDLFKPIALTDWDYLDPGFRNAWRIDGGPLTMGTETWGVREALNAHITTLRIFVVSGTAPDQIADANGDGVVNIRDAQAMGLTPLSRESIVRVQSLHQEVEPALGIPFDFFGDGLDLPPAPAGGGTIRDIPR